MTTLFISHSSEDEAWAKEIHAALVELKYPEPFLSSHPRDGIPVGDKWEQTLWQRLRRSGGMIVLCTAKWLDRPWCVAEAMIARERGKRVFILATADVSDERQTKSATDGEPVPRMPDFLKDTQMISLATTSWEEAHRQLWDRLASLKRESFPPPARPYPGLEPFHESDAAVFFGRDDKIEEVLQVLKRRRGGNAKGFILVLGASGCGKSSLVRAGVLPWLKRASDKKDSKERWLILEPVAAGRGFEGLSTALDIAFQEAGKPSDQPALRRQLSASSKGDSEAESTSQVLCERAGALLAMQRVPDGLVLIVLDQLEEVFATPDGSQARANLRMVLEASADNACRLVVLATMRSDFLNAFQLFKGAAEKYEEVALDPMPRDRFAEIIEGPADRCGLERDPGLAERMAAETAYNDALPLLAFTLEKLYERCKAENRLTRKAYDELGGVDAAIKHAADAILIEAGYKNLPAEDERMRDLRRAFYSLAQVGEEGQFTRRVARWSRRWDSCEAVLKRFVGQRLLVSGRDEQGEATLTVAHEALFRVWDTLNGWLQADRKALALRSQIEDAAAEWQDANRAASRAWAEERVLDAVRVIEDSGVSLSDVSDKATVDAFLGPTDIKQLKALPALDAAEDAAAAGSARFGEAWRLPLGHEARASVGVRLALRGDYREGVGLRADGLPDIDWVDINGGGVRIEIRADRNDPSSEIINRLPRTVAPFGMARYPVTIAQFQAFVGECYRQGEWRLPPGFPVDLPSSWSPPKPRARYGNQPVDSVNWLDASAFCHWLGTRLGIEVRLPTEFEWQLAAVGSDTAALGNWQLKGGLYLPGSELGLKKEYPWGATWDPEQEPWRANTLESGLGRSTAVGMYPAGASPAGVMDMAGTLWEWCSNAFDSPENTAFPASQEDLRVLRGGSWDNDQDGARAAYRYRYTPGNRYNNIGFRVVRLSPSSGD